VPGTDGISFTIACVSFKVHFVDTMQSYTLSAGDNKIDLYSCVINFQTVPFGVNVIAFHKRHPFLLLETTFNISW